MTLQEAEKLFEDFFRNKPKIKKFIDNTHRQLEKDGYVDTLQGFRRDLKEIYSQDRSKQNESKRMSVNTKIQGSGAFLTNNSVIYLHQWLEENNMRSKIVLTVHDSIVIDCPPEEIITVSKVAKYIMENLPIDWLFIDWKGERMRYPIEADIEVGINYNDMVDFESEDFATFNSVEGYCKYYLDLKKVQDYKDAKFIEEDKAEEMTKAIENKKYIYQQQ